MTHNPDNTTLRNIAELIAQTHEPSVPTTLINYLTLALHDELNKNNYEYRAHNVAQSNYYYDDSSHASDELHDFNNELDTKITSYQARTLINLFDHRHDLDSEVYRVALREFSIIADMYHEAKQNLRNLHMAYSELANYTKQLKNPTPHRKKKEENPTMERFVLNIANPPTITDNEYGIELTIARAQEVVNEMDDTDDNSAKLHACIAKALNIQEKQLKDMTVAHAYELHTNDYDDTEPDFDL